MSSKDPLFEQFGKVIPKGQVIFNENDAGDKMFLIRKGKVRISKTFLSGDEELAGGKKLERELVILEHGDFFGEMSLLNKEPRAATAIALEESEVLEIDRSIFENMVKTNGNFALKIISKLCERVNNTDKIIAEILIHQKQRQIIAKLIDLESEYKNQIPVDSLNSVITLENKLTKEDIQNILYKLDKYSIIELNDPIINIVDIENLSRVKAFLEA
ncbi:MAG TPA: cyclic nucleotide-binding domain-containing protein [Spirochaetes bacterium]|nr:cyclic nucleotide-binding domain-containing protein [Spirochaetota bacterium]